MQGSLRCEIAHDCHPKPFSSRLGVRSSVGSSSSLDGDPQGGKQEGLGLVFLTLKCSTGLSVLESRGELLSPVRHGKKLKRASQPTTRSANDGIIEEEEGVLRGGIYWEA